MLGAVKLIVIDCGSWRSGLTGSLGKARALDLESGSEGRPTLPSPQNPPSLFGVSASQPSTLPHAELELTRLQTLHLFQSSELHRSINWTTPILRISSVSSPDIRRKANTLRLLQSDNFKFASDYRQRKRKRVSSQHGSRH